MKYWIAAIAVCSTISVFGALMAADASPVKAQAPEKDQKRGIKFCSDAGQESEDIGKLRARIKQQEEEIKRWKRKYTDARNSLESIASLLGVKFPPDMTVLGLRTAIRIKLGSKCFPPKKRLSKEDLRVVEDLLADEPALFSIIETYHRFIHSLDGGRLIHLPDIP